VPYSDEPYTRHVVRWRGGGALRRKRFTVYLRHTATLSAYTLRAAVQAALCDTAMRSRAQTLKVQMEAHGGCAQALDLIETHLR
jgi:UDP:flavonoid glycosyltransferase YjiC (YdhE family)